MMLRDIVVFCDKPSDVKLFNHLKKHSQTLMNINDNNVKVLPNKNSMSQEDVIGFEALLDNDRADYYFCHSGRPFLVIEITEHGYTGDNCMQRFARIAKTAELKIPFIYFSPSSRTRYDELNEENPSSRNVSSDMFNGFVRLSEIYETPVVFVPWGTGNNGIPLILGKDDPKETGIINLLDLIDALINNHLDKLISHESIIDVPEIKQYLDNTQKLSKKNNVRDSDVKMENTSFEALKKIILDSNNTYDLIPRNYFYKGKSFKLLALMSIDHSKITKAILPDNSEISIQELMDRFDNIFSDKKWLYYYSGYQWRSEPNVGIVTNIDITKCRTQFGKTIYDRKQFLCVHWPRIFWEKDSLIREKLQNELANGKESLVLNDLINEVFTKTEKKPNMKIIGNGSKVFGAWNNGVTVSRIYRSVCDMIILNDVVIIGNKWRQS